MTALTAPASKPKRKLRVRRDPPPGSIVRGARLRLYPKPAQAELLDRWRHRTRQLWNLLLGMERAAYSGEPYMAEVFDWRAIWAEVAQINYQAALDRRQLRLEDGKDAGPDPALPPLDKIMARGNGGAEPRLFIWENDLQKVMARLKQVPHTRWIGDLPSHAAQHVVKDLVKALQAMLRERKKRAAGAGDRKVGFPRFKANHYAAGSVYFANTQIAFDLDRNRIKFPNGVGWVRFDGSRIQKGDKLMGARAWRQGEDWWLSPQFEMPGPAALPLTGREVGVKVGATTLATVYDGKAFDEIVMPAPDKRLARRLKLWSRRLARRKAAQVLREEKLAKRSRKSRRRRVRVARSAGFREASAKIARLQAHEAAVRNDVLHKASRRIVDGADHLSIERLDVAGMMRRADHRALKRQRRRERQRAQRGEATDAPVRHKAPAKVLRRASRRVAMARLLGFIRYKAEDGGRVVTETHVLLPRTQECAACGTLNMMMKDGRVRHECSKCGGIMHRHHNAAENMEKLGRVSRQSGLEAAE